MDELCAREAAVPQAGMRAPGAARLRNIGIQRGEVLYKGPEEGQRALEILLFQTPPQGTDPPFFHYLRLEFSI